MKLFHILFFGIFGIGFRYWVNEWTASHFPNAFPWGTLSINILGSFLVGSIYVIGLERAWLSPAQNAGLMMGFLGGFTTFSAFSLEVIKLIQNANYAAAGLYFSFSPILGVGAAAAGIFITRLFVG